jgi:hypothetical protein
MHMKIYKNKNLETLETSETMFTTLLTKKSTGCSKNMVPLLNSLVFKPWVFMKPFLHQLMANILKFFYTSHAVSLNSSTDLKDHKERILLHAW